MTMKSKNHPKRQQKKRKNEYKKTQRGRRFNPWIYKYFDVGADFKEEKEQ